QTGLGVVLLVDDFDKPMLCAVNNRELCMSFNRSLKTLYSLTKTLGYCIHFSCMAGLTEFSNLSVFSDFNNFRNISLHWRHADLCGITEEELHKYFDDPIRELVEEKKMTFDETCARLKEMYGGYHFSEKSEAVYNPFSVMSALKNKEFGEYWFEAGTPQFLVDLIKSNDYDLKDLGDKMSDYYILCGADSEYIPLESMLYQSGYYTIKDFDEEFGMYTLGFPNREVENAFKECLVKYFPQEGVRSRR
ncbi:MAG: AAA family ATPase, partial [Prevotella sp.]|nr:AAA family ATPase [Prevotella sp.]